MEIRKKEKRIFSLHLARPVQALLIAVAVIVSIGATDPESRFNDLGHKMICTCGVCGQVLLECNHVGCSSSEGMRNELTAAISTGQNDSLVLQSFVQKYGATVLASPTTEGFDLVAWIMPFAVALLALIGTIWLVRHWAKNQPKLVVDGVPISQPRRVDEPMRDRIRRETEGF